MLFLAELLYPGSLLEPVFGVQVAARPTWLLLWRNVQANAASMYSQDIGGAERGKETPLFSWIVLSWAWNEPGGF